MVENRHGNESVPDTRPDDSICDRPLLELLPLSANSGVLLLTRDEALGLLDLALLAARDLTSPQQIAFEKLSALCREMARYDLQD